MEDFKGSTGADGNESGDIPQDEARPAAKARFDQLTKELKARLNTWNAVGRALDVSRATLKRWRAGQGVGDYLAINKSLEDSLRSISAAPPPHQRNRPNHPHRRW